MLEPCLGQQQSICKSTINIVENPLADATKNNVKVLSLYPPHSIFFQLPGRLGNFRPFFELLGVTEVRVTSR